MRVQKKKGLSSFNGDGERPFFYPRMYLPIQISMDGYASESHFFLDPRAYLPYLFKSMTIVGPPVAFAWPPPMTADQWAQDGNRSSSHSLLLSMRQLSWENGIGTWSHIAAVARLCSDF